MAQIPHLLPPVTTLLYGVKLHILYCTKNGSTAEALGHEGQAGGGEGGLNEGGQVGGGPQEREADEHEQTASGRHQAGRNLSRQKVVERLEYIQGVF